MTGFHPPNPQSEMTRSTRPSTAQQPNFPTSESTAETPQLIPGTAVSCTAGSSAGPMRSISSPVLTYSDQKDVRAIAIADEQESLVPLQGDAVAPLVRGPNVIVFGETGVGKSSLINMLADQDIAGVSNQALGYTFESSSYSIELGRERCNIWDTAGLNEGEHGKVPADSALANLQNLVRDLEGRVDLLLYCIRGGRYRDIWKINYDLFYKIICAGKAPIVLVVTGLENEERMESWWDKNKAVLEKNKMKFADHACVTTTKGRKTKSGEYIFKEEYTESEGVVRELVKRSFHYNTQMINGESGWLDEIAVSISEYFATSGTNPTVVGPGEQRNEMRGVFREFMQSIGCLLRWLANNS